MGQKRYNRVHGVYVSTPQNHADFLCCNHKTMLSKISNINISLDCICYTIETIFPASRFTRLTPSFFYCSSYLLNPLSLAHSNNVIQMAFFCLCASSKLPDQENCSHKSHSHSLLLWSTEQTPAAQ